MIIEVTKKIEQKSMVELELPAYFKKGNVDFYKIQEDGSVINAYTCGDYGMISKWKNENGSTKARIEDVVVFDKITEQEFSNAYSNALHAISGNITKEVEA